jgi:hypothetical protein
MTPDTPGTDGFDRPDTTPGDLPQHHFVVVGVHDPATGKVTLWIDNATADARFPDGLVYEPDQGEWTNADRHESDDNLISERLADLLFDSDEPVVTVEDLF